jgi:hypothetical protein
MKNEYLRNYRFAIINYAGYYSLGIPIVISGTSKIEPQRSKGTAVVNLKL